MDLKFVDKRHVYLNGERLRRMRGQKSGDFTRDIYHNDKYIVKIDFNNENQSSIEYKKWNSFLPHHKKYFVPILFFGRINGFADYVIMEKKKFKKNPNPSKHKEKENFIEVLKFYDLYHDISIYEKDKIMLNCGITTDNKIMCYDYGRVPK